MYQIRVINKTNEHLAIQIHNLSADNLDDFIAKFTNEGLGLHLKLVNATLSVEECHKLGLFLKTLPLLYLCLKDSTLSVEASVALYSHLNSKENLFSYCNNSAEVYYQKAKMFYEHPYYPLYMNHARAFEAAAEKIALFPDQNDPSYTHTYNLKSP